MASSNSTSTQGTRIEIAVQPPVRARPNVSLYPPVAFCLVSETEIWDCDAYFVQLFFVQRDDKKYETLHQFLDSWTVTDSGHALPESSCTNGRQAYFYFPDLRIPEEGRWRVHATLYKTDGTRTGPEIVTHSIHVVENTPQSNIRPGMYSSLY
jgi:hypothetical protein